MKSFTAKQHRIEDQTRTVDDDANIQRDEVARSRGITSDLQQLNCLGVAQADDLTIGIAHHEEIIRHTQRSSEVQTDRRVARDDGVW
ncbi:MAG: hypothetical protein ABL997_18130, partial [Planctomycetota bacterium]